MRSSACRAMSGAKTAGNVARGLHCVFRAPPPKPRRRIPWGITRREDTVHPAPPPPSHRRWRRSSHAGKGPGVGSGFQKSLFGEFDAVLAGEDHPVVFRDVLENFIDLRPLAGRGQFDGRRLDHVGAELGEGALIDPLRLLPGSRDDDRLPEQRPGFKPVHRLAQRYHLADDRDRRRPELRLGDFLREIGQRRRRWFFVWPSFPSGCKQRACRAPFRFR